MMRGCVASCARVFLGFEEYHDAAMSRNDEPSEPIFPLLEEYARMVPMWMRFIGAGIGAFIGWYIATHWRWLIYPDPRMLVAHRHPRGGGLLGVCLGVCWPEVIIQLIRLSVYILGIALLILMLWWVSHDSPAVPR
jgi:hypothetical protein